MMQAKSVQDYIPVEIALKLCTEIRDETDQDWTTHAGRWCWACQQASGGDPDQRGFLRKPGNRGCILINARYAAMRH